MQNVCYMDANHTAPTYKAVHTLLLSYSKWQTIQQDIIKLMHGCQISMKESQKRGF